MTNFQIYRDIFNLYISSFSLNWLKEYLQIYLTLPYCWVCALPTLHSFSLVICVILLLFFQTQLCPLYSACLRQRFCWVSSLFVVLVGFTLLWLLLFHWLLFQWISIVHFIESVCMTMNVCVCVSTFVCSHCILV